MSWKLSHLGRHYQEHKCKNPTCDKWTYLITYCGLCCEELQSLGMDDFSEKQLKFLFEDDLEELLF